MHEATTSAWLAKLACRELIEQSVRHVDDGDAEAFSRLFTEDAVLVRPSGAVLHGREAIRLSYAARPADRITRHLVTNVVVAVEEQDRARARSSVLLWTGSVGTPATAFGRPADARQLVGEFDDQLLRMPDGAWRLQRREARFVLHTPDQAGARAGA